MPLILKVSNFDEFALLKAEYNTDIENGLCDITFVEIEQFVQNTTPAQQIEVLKYYDNIITQIQNHPKKYSSSIEDIIRDRNYRAEKDINSILLNTFHVETIKFYLNFVKNNSYGSIEYHIGSKSKYAYGHLESIFNNPNNVYHPAYDFLSKMFEAQNNHIDTSNFYSCWNVISSKEDCPQLLLSFFAKNGFPLAIRNPNLSNETLNLLSISLSVYSVKHLLDNPNCNSQHIGNIYSKINWGNYIYGEFLELIFKMLKTPKCPPEVISSIYNRYINKGIAPSNNFFSLIKSNSNTPETILLDIPKSYGYKELKAIEQKAENKRTGEIANFSFMWGMGGALLGLIFGMMRGCDDHFDRGASVFAPFTTGFTWAIFGFFIVFIISMFSSKK